MFIVAVLGAAIGTTTTYTGPFDAQAQADLYADKMWYEYNKRAEVLPLEPPEPWTD